MLSLKTKDLFEDSLLWSGVLTSGTFFVRRVKLENLIKYQCTTPNVNVHTGILLFNDEATINRNIAVLKPI